MDPKLYNAVMYGHSSLERQIADYSTPNLPVTHAMKNSILHIAAKSRKKKSARKILQLHPSLLHQYNENGDTPQHIAARVGDYEMTAFLISHAPRADLERNDSQNPLRKVNSKGNTVLHEAVQSNRLKIVKILLEKDKGLASINNKAGESPFFLAVDRAYWDIAQHISDKAPDCSLKGREARDTYIIRYFTSAPVGDVSWYYRIWEFIVTQIFFDSSLSYYAIRDLLETQLPILDFAETRLPNIVLRAVAMLLLVLRFVFLAIPAWTGRGGDKGEVLFSLMVREYENVTEEEDENGWTLIQYAAHSGKLQAINYIVEKKRHVTYKKDKEGRSALHIAAEAENVVIIKALVKGVPDISESLDRRGRTALHVAAENGRLSALKVLLDMSYFGDLINHQDNDGNSALHLAARERRYAILDALLRSKLVDKALRNKSQETAFDLFLSKCGRKDHEKGSEDQEKVKMEEMMAKYGAMLSPAEARRRRPVPVRDGDRATRTPTSDPSEQEPNTIVSTIIASVAFAAALQVPGGSNKKGIGFNSFILANYAAFSLAILSIITVRFGTRRLPLTVPVSFFRLSLLMIFVALTIGASLVVGLIMRVFIWSLFAISLIVIITWKIY